MKHNSDISNRTDEVRAMQALVRNATIEGLHALRLSLPSQGATALQETLWNMAADEELRRRAAHRAAR